MMLSVPAMYVTVFYQGDADSMCLPWEGFVDMGANYRTFLDRLAPAIRFV